MMLDSGSLDPDFALRFNQAGLLAQVIGTTEYLLTELMTSSSFWRTELIRRRGAAIYSSDFLSVLMSTRANCPPAWFQPKGIEGTQVTSEMALAFELFFSYRSRCGTGVGHQE